MRRRHVWRTFVCALLSLSLFVIGCGSGDANDESNTAAEHSVVDDIRDRGFLRVGVVSDRDGVSFRNKTTGDYEGFDIELAKALTAAIFNEPVDETNDDMKFVQVTPANRSDFVRRGDVDIALGGFEIGTASEDVTFSLPYYATHGDFLVRSGDGISLTALAGTPVCFVAGTDWETRLRVVASFDQITVLDTFAQCEDALSSGVVKAVVGDQITLAALVQEGDEPVQLAGVPFVDVNFGVAMSAKAPALVGAVNEGLRSAVQNGNWATAFARTLGAFGLPPVIPTGVSTT